MCLGSTRYSPSRHHPATPPRVHLPRGWLAALVGRTGQYPRSNIAVGLISVRQLTLSAQIWGFRGITEVYNLSVARNPDDHKHIPGNK